MRLKGSAYPVYVDGIRYKSMFQASIDTGISYKYLYYKIRDNEGRPVVVKGMTLCDEEWIKQNPIEWTELLEQLENKNRKEN